MWSTVTCTEWKASIQERGQQSEISVTPQYVLLKQSPAQPGIIKFGGELCEVGPACCSMGRTEFCYRSEVKPWVLPHKPSEKRCSEASASLCLIRPRLVTPSTQGSSYHFAPWPPFVFSTAVTKLASSWVSGLLIYHLLSLPACEPTRAGGSAVLLTPARPVWP